MDREPLIAALWNLITQAPGFLTKNRILEHWSSVPAQPALFFGSYKESGPDGPSNLPGPIHLMVEIWIYTKGTERADKSPDRALSELRRGIEDILRVSPVTNTQTLGGLAINARLSWPDAVATGIQEGQAVAVGEVDIMVIP
jgi:hypothetical protein